MPEAKYKPSKAAQRFVQSAIRQVKASPEEKEYLKQLAMSPISGEEDQEDQAPVQKKEAIPKSMLVGLFNVLGLGSPNAPIVNDYSDNYKKLLSQLEDKFDRFIEKGTAENVPAAYRMAPEEEVVYKNIYNKIIEQLKQQYSQFMKFLDLTPQGLMKEFNDIELSKIILEEVKKLNEM